MIFDPTPFLGQDEGQYFDRKSLFHGPPEARRPRDRRQVRDQIAEYVAAFANAEGGVLILGIENDGTVTGHGYPDDPVETFLHVPEVRLHPPQASGMRVSHGDAELLVFEVATADAPVRVEGDGFPLRIGDVTAQVAESRIRNMKLAGLVESWESRPSALTLADLDAAWLTKARAGAGLSASSDEEYLLRRKLAHRRGRELVLRRAAELLFARGAPEHPNAGVRLFRVIGTERRFGAEHNVEERPRIEGPLPVVLDAASETIGRFLRRPSRLVGSRFRETPEYPEFSWKEAVLNAVAHRDYGIEGRTTEVWLYDDRMEVISPGGLVEGLTVEKLESLDRQHATRNPRLVRVLVDLGFMRDQGEGIPRMFAEMEALFLPSPSLEATEREFRLTLRNTSTLTARDKAFVASIGSTELSDEEFRALLEAHRHGRIDNARMRTMTGLDTLGASQVLRRLRDRGLLDLHAAGSASYYTLGDAVSVDRGELDSNRGHLTRPTTSDRGGLASDGGELDSDREGLASDGGGLASDRGGLDSDGRGLAAADHTPSPDDALPAEVAEMLASLGTRPRSSTTRRAILRLAELRPMSPQEIARHLGFKDVGKLVQRHLSPMAAEGTLSRTHPDTPSHPGQKYYATQTRIPEESP